MTLTAARKEVIAELVRDGLYNPTQRTPEENEFAMLIEEKR